MKKHTKYIVLIIYFYVLHWFTYCILIFAAPLYSHITLFVYAYVCPLMCMYVCLRICVIFLIHIFKKLINLFSKDKKNAYWYNNECGHTHIHLYKYMHIDTFLKKRNLFKITLSHIQLCMKIFCLCIIIRLFCRWVIC